MCHEDGEMNMWISKKERARDVCNCELLKVITIKNKMKDAHLRLFRHPIKIQKSSFRTPTNPKA